MTCRSWRSRPHKPSRSITVLPMPTRDDMDSDSGTAVTWGLSTYHVTVTAPFLASASGVPVATPARAALSPPAAKKVKARSANPTISLGRFTTMWLRAHTRKRPMFWPSITISASAFSALSFCSISWYGRPSATSGMPTMYSSAAPLCLFSRRHRAAYWASIGCTVTRRRSPAPAAISSLLYTLSAPFIVHNLK